MMKIILTLPDQDFEDWTYHILEYQLIPDNPSNEQVMSMALEDVGLTIDPQNIKIDTNPPETYADLPKSINEAIEMYGKDVVLKAMQSQIDVQNKD
jgi:hypothetical protein